MADQGFTDAVALLKADHRRVKASFVQYEGTSGTGLSPVEPGALHLQSA